ncbi:hypothetical protein PHLCEN_2v9437, partial [Hermanssonia centrifuga]
MGSLFSSLFGRRDVPRLFYSPSPATVSLRTSHNPEHAEEISLQELVERRCPSLHDVFRQAWWLPNGHFQTAYCVVGDFSHVDGVEYERRLLRTLDGGTL